MLNGLVVGIAIILVSIPIPVVHFVTLPLGPFAAGYVGGNVAKVEEQGVIYYGLGLAGLAVLPALGLILIAIFSDGKVLGFPSGLVIVVAAILVPYVWFASTLGALASYMMRRRASRSDD